MTRKKVPVEETFKSAPQTELTIVPFAESAGLMQRGHEYLKVSTDELPAKMAHSSATGRGLVTNGQLGADLIRLEAGTAFQPHVHPGDHLLFALAGRSTITCGGVIYEIHAGQCYMVPGEIPHAVGALTDVVILAVGSPHKAVDSRDRMKPVAYQEVLADIGEIHCSICNLSVNKDYKLHELDCTHCPCRKCVG